MKFQIFFIISLNVAIFLFINLPFLFYFFLMKSQNVIIYLFINSLSSRLLLLLLFFFVNLTHCSSPINFHITSYSLLVNFYIHLIVIIIRTVNKKRKDKKENNNIIFRWSNVITILKNDRNRLIERCQFWFVGKINPTSNDPHKRERTNV